MHREQKFALFVREHVMHFTVLSVVSVNHRD